MLSQEIISQEVLSSSSHEVPMYIETAGVISSSSQEVPVYIETAGVI